MFEGMVIGMHRGGAQRVVHRAQGVVRPGRRAHLPAALADDRQDRRRPRRQGAAREAVLPARPEGQGRAHEGTEAHGVDRQDARHGRARARPARSRTTSGGSGSCTSRAWTRSGAAAWPGRSSPAAVVLQPGPLRRRRRRLEGADGRRARAAVRRHHRARRSPGRVAIVEPDEIDRINIHRASLQAMRQAVMALVPLPGFVLVDGFRDSRPGDAAAADHRRRSAVDGHRGGVDPGEGHARPPDDRAARARIRATASIATRATRRRDHLDAVGRFGYSPAHRRTFRPPSLFDTIAP